jgi:hypothetical protein
MRPLFARQRQAARGLAVAGLWLSTIGEVFVNAAASHFDILEQDLSYTGRVLRRSPGFAITAVLIVAVGIGATTAAFLVLLRPLPFPEPDRLVKVWETTPGYSRMELSAPRRARMSSPAETSSTTDATISATTTLAVRTTGEPATLAPAVRDVIRRADPTLPITELQTLTDLVDRETASRSVQVGVLAAFAAIAFALAAVGIHGLLSFAVSQRTQEIGVRMALGAKPGDILSMIVRRCLMLAVAGVVPGVLLAYVAGRSMEALLAGVKPVDAPTFAGAVGLSLVMTVLGSLAPTARALRVDPIRALRAE